MPDGFTIDVDVREALQAFDDVSEEVAVLMDAASLETAEAIQREAQARVRRRTGRTARGIEVIDAEDGGYLVVSRREPLANLPLWIEFGTVHMSPAPFFFPSVELEQGPHLRRMARALAQAVT